tara:strand:+ start:2244 stop:2672 length:429 start_codon:yes stop_codon:yes gene_type:complete
MGHHRKQRGHDEQRNYGSRGGESRFAYDEAPRRKRLPLGLIVIGLITWSLLAWGAYLLVDPVLGWFAGSVGPLADAGTGVARWFGLGQQAAALRDVANVDGLAGGLIGLVHFVAKPAIVILWVLGSLALLAAPAILRRRSRW